MWRFQRQNVDLLRQLYVANTFLSRLLGLMGRNHLPPDEGILFPKCNSIHTCFMKFPIDVVFFNEMGEVVSSINELRPWQFVPPKKGVRHTLEMAPGSIARLQISPGEKLLWFESAGSEKIES